MNTVIIEKAINIEDSATNVFSRLLHNRVIFVDDLVNDAAAMDIIAALLFLDKEKEDKITMFINADGGDIRNVFAIYDAMKLTTSPISTFCIGAAMREAVLLLAAGTHGHRLIGKHADICVGQVSNPYMSHSDLTNTKISHDKSIKDNESFMKELSKNTGKSLKLLKKETERQVFLNPTQAVAYGIADKVV